MRHADAVRLAVECMKKEIQRDAVQANLHDMYQADFPAAVNASERRKKLKEAIKILQGQPVLEKAKP